MPIFRSELKQNSPEWLKWREGGLGASVAAIVLHESPFKAPYRLWLELTGRVEPKAMTAAQAHGVASEAFAREQFIREFKMDITPVCAEYDDASYIRASLDGWHEASRTVVEIKCPQSPKDFRAAKEGVIPHGYWIQMQQQMAVVDAKEGIYYCWREGEGIPIPVKFDERFWFDTALPALQEFWRRVLENEWPLPEGIVHDGGAALATAFQVRLAAKIRIEEAERELATAEAAIKRALGDNKTLMGDGFKAYWMIWKPRYYVQIELESREQAQELLPKLEKLKNHKGVKGLEARVLPLNLVFGLK